jgi:hypothetical protein
VGSNAYQKITFLHSLHPSGGKGRPATQSICASPPPGGSRACECARRLGCCQSWLIRPPSGPGSRAKSWCPSQRGGAARGVLWAPWAPQKRGSMETDDKEELHGCGGEGGPHGSGGAFPSGLRVMVVDDDPLCLKVVEQMLKRCNYHVHTCNNAASALELLRDKRHGFDLVLSDVYMPGARRAGMQHAPSSRRAAPACMHVTGRHRRRPTSSGGGPLGRRALSRACAAWAASRAAFGSTPGPLTSPAAPPLCRACGAADRSQIWMDSSCWRRWASSLTFPSSVSGRPVAHNAPCCHAATARGREAAGTEHARPAASPAAASSYGGGSEHKRRPWSAS